MKRGTVFVRAKSPSGKFGSHDVLDLTEESFRAFVVDTFIRLGALAVVDSGAVDDDHEHFPCGWYRGYHLPYHSTKEEDKDATKE